MAELLEVCKGTLQQRILPVFVEKLADLGKKTQCFTVILHKLNITES
jgi:hypothetical protein